MAFTITAEEYAVLVSYAYDQVLAAKGHVTVDELKEIVGYYMRLNQVTVSREPGDLLAVRVLQMTSGGNDLADIVRRERQRQTRLQEARDALGALVQLAADSVRPRTLPGPEGAAARRDFNPRRYWTQAELQAMDPANRIRGDLDSLRSDWVASLTYGLLVLNGADSDEAMVFATAFSSLLDVMQIGM